MDVHVDLYEARVISILELVSLVLPLSLSPPPDLPFARPFRFLPVSIFSRFEMEGKEHVSRDYRQDRGHGGFPEIIRKIFPGRSYVRTFLFGVFTPSSRARARVCNVRAFTGCRWNTSVNISSRTGGFTIGALVLSSWPPSLLIYSAHERCSQITVFFMMLLLHRRTHSFLR